MCLLRNKIYLICVQIKKKKKSFWCCGYRWMSLWRSDVSFDAQCIKKKREDHQRLIQKLDWSNAGNLCNVQWTHDAVVYILSLGLGGGGGCFFGGRGLAYKGTRKYDFFFLPLSRLFHIKHDFFCVSWGVGHLGDLGPCAPQAPMYM